MKTFHSVRFSGQLFGKIVLLHPTNLNPMVKAFTKILAFLLSLFPFWSWAQTDTVRFSAPGGFYEDVFRLELSAHNPQHHIRYTVNGNRPTMQSPVYETPLMLDAGQYSKSEIYTIVNCPENEFFMADSVRQCIVIRAAVFDAVGNCVGPVITNSYFIRALGCDTHGLPAVSLCADSLDLFDYERGIFVPGATYDPGNPGETGNYYQSGREWERLINIEYYEPDNTGINQQAGLRTHGGNGRGIQQKCMKIYAREEYGKKRFKHRFFESTPIESFKHLILKPLTATWFRAGANDHICNQIASPLNLETMASRPVALYLNGEYWGIYFIHEKPDERYLESHCQADINRVNLIESWFGDCEAGTNDSFMELYDFIADHDLADPDAYHYVTSRIDIHNFIDYQIFEIFTANLDWPANNMRCWQEDGGLWRWIFFDGDIALIQKEFDAFANATYDGDAAYPSSSRATLFLRKLLDNETFKVAFINRFNQLLHSVFAYENTKPFTDEAIETLRDEIPNQVERFGNPEGADIWERHMEAINEFLWLRVNHVLAQLNDHYLSNESDLSITAVYPSPAQDEVSIRVHSNRTVLKDVQLFDAKGRLLSATPSAFGTGETEITLPLNLNSGLYVISISGKSRKFVVIR